MFTKLSAEKETQTTTTQLKKRRAKRVKAKNLDSRLDVKIRKKNQKEKAEL